MDHAKINFEDLPQAVSLLLQKVDNLTQLFSSHSNMPSTITNKPFSVQEAATFLKISVNTVYGLVSRRAIPFSKMSKRLYFSESDLNTWIQSGRKSTVSEMRDNSQCVLTPKKIRK